MTHDETSGGRMLEYREPISHRMIVAIGNVRDHNAPILVFKEAFMKKMRYVARAVAVLVLLTLALPVFATGTTEAAAPEDVTMRFSWWGGEPRHEATLAVIDLYQQANPNITIEAEYGGWGGYYEKLVTQLAGGTAADMIQIDQPWLWSFSQQGNFFKDLYDYDEIDLSGFDAAYLQKYCVYNDALQALPAGINAIVMGMTASLFEEMGVPLDTEWNWENFVEIGRTFHETDPETYFYYADSGEIWHLLLMYIQQKYNVNYLINDDYTIGFTAEMIEDGFDYLIQLVETETMVPINEAVTFEGKENPRFVNGNIGTKIGWSSHIRGWQDANLDVEVGRVPIRPGAEETGVIVRPSMTFGVNAESEYDVEAVKFIDFFFNDEDAILAHGMQRSVPPTENGREVLRAADALDLDLLAGVQANLAVAGTSPNGPSYDTELEDIYKDLIEQVAFQTITPEEATQALIERFEIRLAEMRP